MNKLIDLKVNFENSPSLVFLKNIHIFANKRNIHLINETSYLIERKKLPINIKQNMVINLFIIYANELSTRHPV